MAFAHDGDGGPDVPGPAITPLYHVVPFVTAYCAFIVARSSALPDVAAPVMAGVASLSVAGLVCIILHETAALFSVACGLANVGVAFLIFPWSSGAGESAIAAWVAASDLLVIAFFGTDHLIALRRHGAAVRSMASGVAFQAGLLLCAFCWPTPAALIAIIAVYAAYTAASAWRFPRLRAAPRP